MLIAKIKKKLERCKKGTTNDHLLIQQLFIKHPGYIRAVLRAVITIFNGWIIFSQESVIRLIIWLFVEIHAVGFILLSYMRLCWAPWWVTLILSNGGAQTEVHSAKLLTRRAFQYAPRTGSPRTYKCIIIKKT